MRIVIVTGLSGAGKSTVVAALEDLGFYCCDNLPVTMLAEFVKNLEESSIANGAISIDGRQTILTDYIDAELDKLRKAGHTVETIFLEAEDGILIRRYSQTRRRHPLSGDDVGAGIARDREILAPLRSSAQSIDTSGLTVHELKAIVSERFRSDGGAMSVSLQSFGFKYGLPRDLDVVFDVRFLPNPYFVEDLRPRDGRQKVVSDYVLTNPKGKELFERISDYLKYSLPNFESEGKLYSTIGIGCTGGRHRSVALVEAISKELSETWEILVRHRDVNRAG